MEVCIKLFAHYRNGRYAERMEKVADGTTVSTIIRELGVDQPDDPIGILLINGRHAKRDDVLRNNDVLSIFPMLGGG
jgi:molybdopterin converting factor small subunit